MFLQDVRTIQAQIISQSWTATYIMPLNLPDPPQRLGWYASPPDIRVKKFMRILRDLRKEGPEPFDDNMPEVCEFE